MGGPSRIVQQILRAGPIIQVCRPASVAGYALDSSTGSRGSQDELRARLRAPVRGSLDVELVALRVEHRNAVLTMFSVGGDEGGPGGGQPFDGLINADTPV
jgi:hypothetical protein